MKRPSFQFYPGDWLSDPNVIAMSAQERGAYIQLISVMWNTEDCSLDPNEEYLAKIGQVDKVVITSIYHCFKVVNNRLRHKRLDLERDKQDEYRKSCSKAGKLGMEKRWKTANKGQSDKVVITEDNSSTPSSTSISSSTTNNDSFVPMTEKQRVLWHDQIKKWEQTTGREATKEIKLLKRDKILNR